MNYAVRTDLIWFAVFRLSPLEDIVLCGYVWTPFDCISMISSFWMTTMLFHDFKTFDSFVCELIYWTPNRGCLSQQFSNHHKILKLFEFPIFCATENIFLVCSSNWKLWKSKTSVNIFQFAWVFPGTNHLFSMFKKETFCTPLFRN